MEHVSNKFFLLNELLHASCYVLCDLALLLFMFWSFTNDTQDAAASDNLTVFANLFYGSPDFHTR